jgi:hypothetical protein
MIDFHPHIEPCYRCEAVAWECIGEFIPHRGRPQDVIECAFCGAMLRVDAVARPAAPRPQHGDGPEFKFQFGRFAGMTLAEADAEPNGRRYLEVMRDTSPKLRDRIVEYLNHAAPSA